MDIGRIRDWEHCYTSILSTSDGEGHEASQMIVGSASDLPVGRIEVVDGSIGFKESNVDRFHIVVDYNALVIRGPENVEYLTQRIFRDRLDLDIWIAVLVARA